MLSCWSGEDLISLTTDPPGADKLVNWLASHPDLAPDKVVEFARVMEMERDGSLNMSLEQVHTGDAEGLQCLNELTLPNDWGCILEALMKAGSPLVTEKLLHLAIGKVDGSSKGILAEMVKMSVLDSSRTGYTPTRLGKFLHKRWKKEQSQASSEYNGDGL